MGSDHLQIPDPFLLNSHQVQDLITPYSRLHYFRTGFLVYTHLTALLRTHQLITHEYAFATAAYVDSDKYTKPFPPNADQPPRPLSHSYFCSHHPVIPMGHEGKTQYKQPPDRIPPPRPFIMPGPPPRRPPPFMLLLPKTTSA
jgi:hypothetical protein